MVRMWMRVSGVCLCLTAGLALGCQPDREGASDPNELAGATGSSDGTSAAQTDGADGAVATDGLDTADGGPASDGTDSATDTPSDAITWKTHVAPILANNCVRCHAAGQVREDTPLDDYATASSLAMLIKDKVVKREMPPWFADDCRDYAHDERLTEEEISWIAEWADTGATEGPADAEALDVPVREFTSLSREDLEISMEADYIPVAYPDDYRCFVLDWPLDEVKYITGFGAKPGNPRMVHHIIAYLYQGDAADAPLEWDAADEGPGYNCFGGPSGGDGTNLNTNVRFLGGWAPGGVGSDFPAGTGMKVLPGARIVLQLHYNILTNEPEPDRTSFVVKVDDSVEKIGFVMPWTQFPWIGGAGMTIPAGEKEVTHSHAADPNQFLSFFGDDLAGKQLKIYSANLHMHTLGVGGRTWIERQDGEVECLLEMSRYDFGWQRSYGFTAPVAINPGDKLGIECTWDNSPENQVWVDGEQIEPVTQHWGEGTTDEMCIGFFYATVE